jgi:hypothetical protein
MCNSRGVGQIQPIMHAGRVVAALISGRAIISEALPTNDQLLVKAMCCYALDIAEGRVPGPYSDVAALAYARAAVAARN